MSEETAYLEPRWGRLDHAYGPNVHILSDPFGLRLLARLSEEGTTGRELHALLTMAYERLGWAIVEQLPVAEDAVQTRMFAQHPEGVTRGRMTVASARVVLVDIARAGMVPCHVLQLFLLHGLEDAAVSVDHVYMQRVTDPATGAVSGVHTSGSKVNPEIEGATVVVPDPMGATGSSVCQVLESYTNGSKGTPRKIVLAHLIVTPEYLKRVTTAYPDAVIVAMRVDRGLSAPEVLATRPGERWDEERGLNEHQYIVPGAGGVGELLSNVFV